MESVAGKKRRQGRELADWIGAFGCLPRVRVSKCGKWRGISYACYVALYLHIGRVRLQRAWAVAQGEGISRSSKSLPPGVFDAIALSEEEASSLALDVNSRRAHRRHARKFGRNGLGM